MQSALEVEIQQRLRDIAIWLRSHDRGVLFALLVSIPPFPPLPILGFVLSLINFWLWRGDRLAASEGQLIKITMVLSVITTALGVILTMYIVTLLRLIPEQLPAGVNFLHSLLDVLRGLLNGASLSRQSIQI